MSEIQLPDPSDFDWYLDAGKELVVGCYALGTGAGEPRLAALGRQLAEDFADILCLRSSFVTVPQFLTVRQPDSDLTSSKRIRPAFAVFHSLPETRLVKQSAARIRARFALTGRLVGDGTDYLFGANLLDVERTTILGCAQVQIPRENLVDALVDVAVYLLRRFQRDESPEALAERVREVIGTSSYNAWYNFALARDQEREVMGDVAELNARRLAGRLILALENDPLYTRPLERLARLFDQVEDEGMWQTMARSLARVPLGRPAIGLLKGEAHRRLGELEEAREAFEAVTTAHPGAAQAWFLRGEIERSARPGVARQMYMEASRLDPQLTLFKERLESLNTG